MNEIGKNNTECVRKTAERKKPYRQKSQKEREIDQAWAGHNRWLAEGDDRR